MRLGKRHVEAVPAQSGHDGPAPRRLGFLRCARRRPCRSHRRRPRHDDVRTPRRPDPSAEPHAARRPAAQDQHARRCRDRSQHREHELPRRAPTRARDRDGRPHRRRSRRDVRANTRTRAVRAIPQLLRNAALRPPAAHRVRTDPAVRPPHARARRRITRCGGPDTAGGRITRARRRARRRHRRHVGSATTRSTSRSGRGPSRRRTSRTTPAGPSTASAAAQVRGVAHRPRLPVARDTDWFWCSALRRATTRRTATGPATLPAERHLVADRRIQAQARWKARLDRRRGLPEREEVVQDVEIPVDRLSDFMTFFAWEVPIACSLL